MYLRIAAFSLSASLMHSSLALADARPVLGSELVLNSSSHGFDVAFNGTDYLAVWTDDSTTPRVFGQLLNGSEGQPLAPSFPIAATGSGDSQAAVASDGDGFLVTWVHGPKRGQIRATRVTAEGVVLDGDGAIIRDEDGFDSGGVPIKLQYRGPDVAWGGTQWLIGWWDSQPDEGGTEAIRVSRDGAPVGDVIRLSGASGAPVLASNGVDFVALVPECDGAPSMIFIHADGSIAAWNGLYDSTATYCEGGSLGGVASDGRDYLVTFEGGYSDERNAGIWIATFDGVTGAHRGRRQVSAAPHTGSAIQFRNGRYLLAWDEGSEVRAARFTADLELIDGAAGFQVLNDAAVSDVADGGENAFIAAVRGADMVVRPISFASVPYVPTPTPGPTATPSDPSASPTPSPAPSPVTTPSDSATATARAGSCRCNVVDAAAPNGVPIAGELLGFLLLLARRRNSN